MIWSKQCIKSRIVKESRSDFVEIDGFEDLQIIIRGHLKIGTFTSLCKFLINEAHQTKLKQQK